jgi:hypothetical protein
MNNQMNLLQENEDVRLQLIQTANEKKILLIL